MQFAMLFPGQGSQSVGMLGELSSRYPVVRETFEEGADALGFDLWKLVQNGPEAALNLTRNTQPALLAAGVAVWRVWQSHGNMPDPAVMAGHSLGEYTALTCAGAMDYSATIRLVAQRGQFMQEAVAEGEGGMAAIIGLDDERVQEICSEVASGDVLEPVNYNAPGQVVIAGHRAAVERGIQAARSAGAKLATVLSVSVPAHSSLMRAAAERLGSAMADVAISAPKIPVLHNVDGKPRNDAQGIRQALIEQLSSPVRWVDCIRNIGAHDVQLLLECGPGRVLTGLNRRIDRRVRAAALSEPTALQQSLEHIEQD